MRVPGDRHGLDIVIDDAASPAAVANALAVLRPLAHRRLICVRGCDPERALAFEAECGADLVVIACRHSSADRDHHGPTDPWVVDRDRGVAIAAAIAEATPGDVVLIAGPGTDLGADQIDVHRALDARPVWSAADVCAATGAVLRPGAADTTFGRVVIDGRTEFGPGFDPTPPPRTDPAPAALDLERSRAIRFLALEGARRGDLHVAITGSACAGDEYVDAAIAGGAAGVIVGRGFAGALPPGRCVLEVDDPNLALGRLAHHHRLRWGGPLVAITGSTGKTAVKDLVTAALYVHGQVRSPPGSFNTAVSVPLALLGLRAHHRHAVVELGMRGPGQIDHLAQVSAPDIAVVTNAGKAHLGLLGSESNIARAKSEIFTHLRAGGRAVVPADDPRLLEPARHHADQVLTFGWSPGATVVVSRYEPTGIGAAAVVLAHGGETARARLPLAGRHNAENAACAVAAAIAAGVPFAAACDALRWTRPSTRRGEVEVIGGRHVMVDCYSANPVSMRAALATLSECAGGRNKVALLGEMLELGDATEREHFEIGQLAASLGVRIVALGEHRMHVVAGARSAGGDAREVEDMMAAAAQAWADTREGDWLLVKASRRLGLERVVERWRDSV